LQKGAREGESWIKSSGKGITQLNLELQEREKKEIEKLQDVSAIASERRFL